jgi:hypothetical protein
MPMATIHKVGQSGDLYHVHFLDPHRPEQGLPGHGHPDHDLPGQGARPDQGLPGGGAHPGNRPPGSGGGGHPDHSLPGQGGIPSHELPDQPPPQVQPGHTLVLVRDQQGKWHYASIAPGSPPPRPVPMPPHPGGGPMPGNPNLPNQGLPGAQPKPA